MPLLIWVVSALLCLSPQSGSGAAPAPSRDAILTASRTIMANARYATLVTANGANQPDARIVDPFAPEGELTIWFATNTASRKVAELKKDARVTLLYFDTTSKSYVTVKGTARLVVDPAEKKKRWKDEWTGMWKDKNTGDDYLLVRVDVDTLEVVSVSLGMNNDPTTWKPVTLKIR